MAIATWIIGGAIVVGLICKFFMGIHEGDSFWVQTRTCLNVLAAATLGAGLGLLFYVVSGLI